MAGSSRGTNDDRPHSPGARWWRLIEKTLDEYGSLIERELRSRLAGRDPELDGFYAMMREQLGVSSAAGRRRIFPLLCLFSCDAVGGDSRGGSLRCAVAIELLANWFELHDRIELNDAREDLWRRWGMPQAINTGDGLFPLAATAMLEAVDDPNTSLALARGMTDVAVVHMRTQHSLLEAPHASVEEEMRAIEDAAGTLGGYAAWAGARVAMADEASCERLSEFGHGVGVSWGVTRRLRYDDLPNEAIAAFQQHERQALGRGLASLGQAGLPAAAWRTLEAFARGLA